MPKIKVEVDGIESTLTRFKRDLHRGMENSVRNLSDIAKDEAREILELNDRIFNRDVYQKFKYVETESDPTQVSGKLVNYAEHSGAVEHGVPASEYSDGGPPVQALLPWVEEKMDGFTLSSGGSSGGGGGVGISEESNEVVDESNLSDNEDTEDSLTFSKQADDLSENSGDLSNTHRNFSQNVVLDVERYQREYDMPRVESISDGDYNTIEDAFADSSTITIPNNLFEYVDWSNDNVSDYIEDKNADTLHFNVNDTANHDQYIVRHQYGRYIYENLTQTGKDEFRKRWGFTETSSGWELPDDGENISTYATKGEAEFFAEAFVGRDSLSAREVEKWNYFNKIESLNSDYFTDSFLSKSTDTPDYPVGKNYDSGEEIVTEQELNEFDEADFTTEFSYSTYQYDASFKEHEEYVFTSSRFDGARILTYRDGAEGERFGDPTAGYTYDREDLTLQGVSESEVIFNNIDPHDQLIIKEYDRFGSYTGDHAYVDIGYHAENQMARKELVSADDVFTDDHWEVRPDNIVGTREENPELWADGIDTIEPVSTSEIEDWQSSDFVESEIHYRDVVRAQKEEGHIVVENSDGQYYRAEVSSTDYDGDLMSLKVTEDGERLTWQYDYGDPANSEVNIRYIPERQAQYQGLQDGDDIIVDPDQLDDGGRWTDSVYRATIKRVGGIHEDTPYVRPFGTSTDYTEKIPLDAFVATRESTPGWNAKNWDKGRKVTIELRGKTYTGHVSKTEDYFHDSKSYEVNRMEITTPDGDVRKFTAEDVKSDEDDGFMDIWHDAPSQVDNSSSKWNDIPEDTSDVPDNSDIYFYSHREDEIKKGRVRHKIGTKLFITGESGIEYTNSPSSLYPVTSLGYTPPE